ncbi:MAG: transporter substrate-binding domain-containing protein [Chloroflexi bacterium]|nr:transporter substrate-binding domain-containing protein [Chloroflexota bacterium]
MNKQFAGFALLIVASLILAACGAGGGTQTLLEQIEARGTMIVSTDPNYEPQSFLDPNGQRAANTKCADDQLTAGEMVGFDVDVAVAIAERLGVEACFVTPDWDIITAGNWGDRWDISVGSMTITTARQQILDFVTPYYFTPAQFAAAAASGITSVEDLNGQAVCVGTATTYEDWLNSVDLGLPAESLFMQPPSDVTVVTLPTDQECAQSIAAGRTEFSVYLTSGTVVDSNIANGLPVVKVGGPAFSENLAAAIDKGHSLDTASFVAAVDAAVNAMHTDGTLSQLSIQWFGVDLTQDPTQ